MVTVVVADDSSAGRQYFCALLEYAGHRVLPAEDGSVALELIRRERPDLVLTDLLMPGMDGYELVRAMRDDPDLAGIPVIFCSALYDGDEAQELARQLEAELIRKPADPEVVLGLVDQLIQEPTIGKAPTVSRRAFDAAHARLVTNKLLANADELRLIRWRLDAVLGLKGPPAPDERGRIPVEDAGGDEEPLATTEPDRPPAS